jgi:hypothetical protein
MTAEQNNFERWGNLMSWILTDGNDFVLLERSAYFAEIHFPKSRRFTGGLE